MFKKALLSTLVSVFLTLSIFTVATAFGATTPAGSPPNGLASPTFGGVTIPTGGSLTVGTASSVTNGMVKTNYLDTGEIYNSGARGAVFVNDPLVVSGIFTANSTSYFKNTAVFQGIAGFTKPSTFSEDVTAYKGLQVGSDLTVSGQSDMKGSILNTSTTSNFGEVWINDDLRVKNYFYAENQAVFSNIVTFGDTLQSGDLNGVIVDDKLTVNGALTATSIGRFYRTGLSSKITIPTDDKYVAAIATCDEGDVLIGCGYYSAPVSTNTYKIDSGNNASVMTCSVGAHNPSADGTTDYYVRARAFCFSPNG